MNDTDKLMDLIKRDREIKEAQEQLNKDISAYIAESTGIRGPATLLDIMLAVKAKHEPSRLITP